MQVMSLRGASWAAAESHLTLIRQHDATRGPSANVITPEPHRASLQEPGAADKFRRRHASGFSSSLRKKGKKLEVGNRSFSGTLTRRWLQGAPAHASKDSDEVGRTSCSSLCCFADYVLTVYNHPPNTYGLPGAWRAARTGDTGWSGKQKAVCPSLRNFFPSMLMLTSDISQPRRHLGCICTYLCSYVNTLNNIGDF